MTRPLIIDSFAGGGGASTAIEQALGVSPDYAINHDNAALALHAANHPETQHLCTSVYAVDPRDLVKKGQRIGFAWFSPDCKHFSKARGGTPVNKNIRDLAWVAVHWVEKLPEESKPEVIGLENVEEFVTWSPLRQKQDAEGNNVFNMDGTPYMEPDPSKKGQTFKQWVRRLRNYGYKVKWKMLRACDYGAPTIRKRLFLIARRDGRRIVWPKPTHGNPASVDVQQGKLLPWRSAAECIDWTLPCPSIFDTKAEVKEKHGLTVKRPLVPNTLARIARGMKRYVLDAQKPFVVNTGTETQAPSIMRHFGRSVGQDATAPAATIVAGGGGKTAIIAPSITRFNGGATGQDLRDPLATITANSFIKKPGGAAPLGMIAPYLARTDMTSAAARNGIYHATEPLRTQMTSSSFTLVAPHLLSLKGTSRRSVDVNHPHPAVLAGGGHSALIAPVLSYAQQGGRNRSVADPVHTITASTKDQNAVIAPLLVQTGYGERKGQKPRALDPFAPLGTIVAGGVKHAPAAAFLAQHNTARQGVNPGRDAGAPISTLTGSGSHQNAVAAFLAKYYGTDQDPRLDEPLHTVTTKDRFGHVQAELSAPEFSAEHETRARQVAEFLREHDAWDGGEFVTIEIDGNTYVIVDIGMRMLTPRELYNAQGFPPDYVIEGVWSEQNGNWSWHPFTKDVQIKCCGNSVSPHPARALIEANCGHLREELERAAA